VDNFSRLVWLKGLTGEISKAPFSNPSGLDWTGPKNSLADFKVLFGNEQLRTVRRFAGRKEDVGGEKTIPFSSPELTIFLTGGRDALDPCRRSE